MYAARKNFDFSNMLLAALYALHKNLEKAHIRQIRAKDRSKIAQKGSNLTKMLSLAFGFCPVSALRFGLKLLYFLLESL